MVAAKKVSKKVVTKKGSKEPVQSKTDPLFPSRKRNHGIGGDIQPKRDLSRFVKWPRYVRIQRQRSILYQRLKIPPVVNQFTKVLAKNEAATVFSLFNKYRPETKAAKKQRINDVAAATASGSVKASKAPIVVKFGLKHVTTLVEEKKAELVLIANDVNPLELVLWLPALCRKMQVPFMIVKDKARLGALVHQRNAACVALTAVGKDDNAQLTLLKNLAMEKYNNNVDLTRKWGGGIMGLKTQAKLEKRAKMIAVEEAKKAKSMNMA